MARTDIRLALPSKGRLEPEVISFLEACGLKIYKPNPRQYQAVIPAIPGLTVLLQRPGDLVVGVREGSIDFGIAGLDSVEEYRGNGAQGAVLVLHDALGFGHCALALAVPEAWAEVDTVDGLRQRFAGDGRPLRVATKFPNLTRRFLEERGFANLKLIAAEGTLEVAPAIGYADVITDLVSSGTTLRDNRLRALDDGTILQSQAVLIANRRVLRERPEALAVAHELLETIEAHLRAERAYHVFANMRGATPEAIASRMFAEADLGGLQGPTISRVIVRDAGDKDWHAVNIIVAKQHLTRAIAALRRAGGSGVIVSPVTYIFEEESARYQDLLRELERGAAQAAP